MTNVALIPTYQPDEHLLATVSSLAEQGFARVVVDDGSGPAYAQLLGRLPQGTVLLGYGENRGKGAALKLGLGYILTHFPANVVVVTVDGDGQHAPADALRCAQAAQADPGAIVLGCRSFDEKNVPLRSRIGNVFSCLAFKLASGHALSDTQTGLRAFSARLIPQLLNISGKRYEYEMNELFSCVEEGVEIREVPIQTIYRDNNAHSHFNALRDSFLIYRGILMFLASSFSSFLIDFCTFVLLSTLLGAFGAMGVLAANVIARVVSAICNYTMNRRLVFKSTEKASVTAPRYALLATTILAANTLALKLALDLGVPALQAKIAVEIVLFFASWVLQNRVVFSRKDR